MTDTRESGELMYVQCMYCREWMGVKPGKIGDISHSVCPECSEKLLAPGRAGRAADLPKRDAQEQK